MRRRALAGLIVASALSLLPASAGAWPGAPPFVWAPAPTEVWSGATWHGSPSLGRPLGELQNEAWGRYLRGQYLKNNPPSSRVPGWTWIAPAWRWNGFRWIWIPGYWIPRR